MKFNVKNKANYDKEFGTNEVYQFIFGEEFLELMYANVKKQKDDDDLFDDDDEDKKPKAKKKELADLEDRNVEYPNHVYITIRGNKNCSLDVAC